MNNEIEFTNYPNEYYKKFFEKFSEINTLEISQWKPIHILSYWCKKYKENYNISYKFKFNSPQPSKCFEIFQAKKLALNLTSDPKLLKEYIDWIFFHKIPAAKRKITSISFLTNEATLTEYKYAFLFVNKSPTNFDRSTPLPDNYKAIFTNLKLTANTYGDLAFMDQITPVPVDIASGMEQLKALGFDRTLLGKII